MLQPLLLLPSLMLSPLMLIMLLTQPFTPHQPSLHTLRLTPLVMAHSVSLLQPQLSSSLSLPFSTQLLPDNKTYM
jgi:hypothetical protein